MIYISVFSTLEKSTKKWSIRNTVPSGVIVVTDDCGDAIYYPYTRKRIMEICKEYYMHPECTMLIDPYIVGITKQQEKYAHQELGFIAGCSVSAGIRYKAIYKKTYFRYFGLLPTADSVAYSYCLANYPKLRMLYDFKNKEDADNACSAYLMTRYMEAKAAMKVRWDSDLQYIIEELDDANEERDIK